MKKQILSLALVAGAIFTANAQNIYTTDGSLTGNRTVTMNGRSLSFSGGTGMYLSSDCKLGLGTSTPEVKFEVIKSLPSSGSVDISFFGTKTIQPDQPTVQFPIYHDGMFIQQKNYGANIQLRTAYPSFDRFGVSRNYAGYAEFNTAATTNTIKAAISFGIAETELMRINTDGKVRIANGTTDLPTPAGYRLFVDEGILTEKVKVALKTTADWADYVFASDYKLMPLSEVEKFTKENKHLPNVPSSEEMVEKGLNVAEMDSKLLEKIEELTLYAIDQEKQIDFSKNEINTLQTTITNQQQEIDELKAQVKLLFEKTK